MNAGERMFLCNKCRKRVSYHLFKRPAIALIKDLEIKYDEYYGICDECKNEIFIPGIEDLNEERIETIYRQKKGLITIPEINALLKKYNIEKRPLSKLLGLGELTITRYLDGQLPSKRYSDILFEILKDEQKMKAIALKNKESISKGTFDKVMQAIEICQKEKKYSNSAEKIALYVIKSGKEITNLLLQKVLYYIKGISDVFYDKTIILEPCEAWRLGPVFPTVYEKYKEFGKQEITTNISSEYVGSLLSEKEKKVTDLVLETFGIYNAWFLKDLTHAEEPWISARAGMDENDASRNIMDENLIMDYFKRMDLMYDLKSPEGIDTYISDMKKKIQL